MFHTAIRRSRLTRWGLGLLITAATLVGMAAPSASAAPSVSLPMHTAATSASAPATAAESTDTTTVVDNTQPAAGMADCPASNFCAWDNYNFSGGPGEWSGNAPNYTFWPHSGCGFTSLYTWDNCASSVYNHGTSCNLTFYDGINYTGAHYNLPRGSYLARMTLDKMSDGGSANDRISSHRWCTF